MGNDSLRRLAGELKNFLLEQDEDELITTAAPISREAVGVSRTVKEPQSMAEGSTLTVDFRRTEASKPATTVQTTQTPTSGQEGPLMTTAQKQKALLKLADSIRNCSRCPLGATRLNAVPGEGNVDAELMFVGEGPGYDEDRQGRPFVGRAGQLLDKMIAAMGLTREQVFIANIAKCHPMTDPLHPEKHGNDRAPNAGEIACCRKFLEQQIAIICPKYIVALGGVSAKALISDA